MYTKSGDNETPRKACEIFGKHGTNSFINSSPLYSRCHTHLFQRAHAAWCRFNDSMCQFVMSRCSRTVLVLPTDSRGGPTVNCSALATCGSADDDDWVSYLKGRKPFDTMHRQRTAAIVSVQCDSDILPWRLGC